MLAPFTALATVAGGIPGAPTNPKSGSIAGVFSVSNLFGSLMSSGFISKTLGQIGEGLDCVGASWTPNKAKMELERDDIPLIRQMAENAAMPNDAEGFQAAVNGFFDWFYSHRIHHRYWLKTSAKDCTRRGLTVLIKGVDAAKAQAINGFRQAAAAKGFDFQMVASERKPFFASRFGRSMDINVERVQVKSRGIAGAFFGGSSASGQSASGTLLVIAALALFFGRKFVKK